jgi:hydroxymethylpyrimidine/phosphomethylpyrimidine kinase
VALTIAGTDSGAGAGVAADLRTFAAHDVFGTFAVSAVTAQNTVGVQRVQALPALMVVAQIETVVSDLHPVAAKTGMLATPEIVSAVTELVAAGTLPALVVDPVLVDSSGRPLFEGNAMRDAYLGLIAGATVATPNLSEASLLVGRQIDDEAAMEEAARELQAVGAGLVIVKGGRPRLDDEAVDVAFDGRAVSFLRAPWLETRNVHGTGCSFAAAIAAHLARGATSLEAAVAAKSYVHRAIALAADWRLGAGHGPIDQIGAAPTELRRRLPSGR